jgi:hypothetical protein
MQMLAIELPAAKHPVTPLPALMSGAVAGSWHAL